jgi:murein DD-endopeptidase MepM/ murein hydrolase activator NlpD
MTILTLLASVLLTAAPWLAPVTPMAVERPFSAPAGPYAPGHRGVDLRAPAGTVVRAPAPGIVRAAGRVAGKLVVSIEHPHRILGRTGWRTTYDGVAAEVEVGDRLVAGDRIGTAIGHPAGDAHARGIHWGLRNGRTYADPLMLLNRTIVLKPLERS